MNEWKNNVPKDEEREIDIFRLLQIVWKRIWLIVLVSVIFCVGAYLYSSIFITPTYRTSFTAYVDNRATMEQGDGKTTTTDLSASIYLTRLYQEIIVSRSVLNDAVAKCGLNMEYTTIRGKVSTTVADDAALITVSVVDTDPERAVLLANAIAEVAPEHVARMKEGSSMRILDAPVLPNGKYAPSNSKNALLGGAIGFVLITVLVLVVDLVNDIVRNSDELEHRYNLVVIGTIPDLATADKSQDNYAYAYRKAGKKK